MKFKTSDNLNVAERILSLQFMKFPLAGNGCIPLMQTPCVSFFIGGNSEDEYAAPCCRRSHLSGSENSTEGSLLREAAVSRFYLSSYKCVFL